MLSTLKSRYAGRRVLVVGGSGFLGRNFLRALLMLGAEVTATGSGACAIEGVRWLGPLRFASLDEARRAVAGQHVVIDCIGRLGAADSNLYPTVSLEQELAPQLNLIVACTQATPAPVFVLASSRLVYGTPLALPVNEQHPLQPSSLYALHKITAESYLRILSAPNTTPFCIFRLSNPYGPFQPASAKGYGVINSFLQRAARHQPIEIFGTGDQRRDYIHIDDVIEAMLRAAATPGAYGQTFNLGSGVGIPLRQATQTIQRLAGSPPTVHRPWPGEALAVETGDYISDLSHLRSTIGAFHPRALDEGLADCIEHYRSGVQASLPARPFARPQPSLSA